MLTVAMFIQQSDLFTIKTAEFLLTTGTYRITTATDMTTEWRRFPKRVWDFPVKRFPN